jgi:hypothetical protein
MSAADDDSDRMRRRQERKVILVSFTFHGRRLMRKRRPDMSDLRNSTQYDAYRIHNSLQYEQQTPQVLLSKSKVREPSLSRSHMTAPMFSFNSSYTLDIRVLGFYFRNFTQAFFGVPIVPIPCYRTQECVLPLLIRIFGKCYWINLHSEWHSLLPSCQSEFVPPFVLVVTCQTMYFFPEFSYIRSSRS